MVYRGRKTQEISFPLGGIGTGCIGLAGNGLLKDWEIFNKPNKGSFNGFSHFAVKAESGNKVLDTRVLVSDEYPPFTGADKAAYSGFGFGLSRSTLQGIPHFQSSEFTGEFPFATIRFKDKKFPGKVSLQAFNPFIPLNDRDSSLPAAFFTVTIKNNTTRKIPYTVSAVLKNPQGKKSYHRFHQSGTQKVLNLSSKEWQGSEPEYGNLSLATDAEDYSYQEYWYRGGWFDNLGVYWRDFTQPGKFKNRSYPYDGKNYDDHADLAAHFSLNPGETKEARFVLTWNFPNMTNYWNPEPGDKEKDCKPKTWKNYYATIFKDSTESAGYALRNWNRLYEETLRFKKTLFSSTVPDYVMDAVSANLSILKSPTVLRLEDGSFYGFEGCSATGGCCEGSCTHVWNYAYALPFLFPELERSMRNLEYKYSMRPDGKIGFRLQMPIGRPLWDWHACADGQFGGIIKSYRDWKISGDSHWLKSIWESIKKTLEFAWAETNEDKWDSDKDGVLEGRQHHTLDTELFGPNSYLTGFYLAALKAASKMADYFGEKDNAKKYQNLFLKGKRWSDQNLFNGEYYFQKIDLKDKSVLERYREFDRKFGSSVEEFYWDTEHQEIKHQIGNGCHCDQVVAQWHANICGLGEIFDRKKVKKALKSIYRYNFKKTMRDFFNACRIFALNDESALVICDWPKKGKPAVPLTYAEEAMNGFEYQAAIHMLQEGLVKEGLEVVKAIRDRYDGEKRNPWNEFECGSNYARSTASYALLPALSGFEFDMVKGHLGFHPVREEKKCQYFWSLDCAWGTYQRNNRKITLKVEKGILQLKSFSDSLLKTVRAVKTNTGRFQKEGNHITFSEPVTLKSGEKLTIEILNAG
ncbi:MAG: GH116 family glycosyl-hydrolase [Candidatus Omnitrophota bacterium]